MDWLSLFLVALLFATTYILTIYGLIGAIITCVLVLMCASLAFGTYEWLAFSFLTGPLGDLAPAVAMMAMFVVPLIALRFALDALITRASLIPALIDRIVGVGFAFLAAYVMTGVVAVSISLLPLGGSFLGHHTFDATTDKENHLWMTPDRFAVSFASMMSHGLLSGRRDWRDDHPDLVQEIAWAQAPDHNVRHVVPEGSVRLVKPDIREYIFEKTPGQGRGRRATPPSYKPISPPSGKYWLALRLQLLKDASGEDQTHRFSRRQVRLVGREHPGAAAENFAPVAMNDNDDPKRAVKIEDGKLYGPESKGEVDFVYEVPDDFVPMYLTYKIGARVDLSTIELAGDGDDTANSNSPSSAASSRTTDSRESAGRSSSRAGSSTRNGRGGRVSGARGTGDATFSDALPMEMTSYQSIDLDQRNGELANGHIYGNSDEQGSSGSNPKLTKFKVDPSKRMFQLDVKILRAGSILGKALSFAVTTLKNYRLTDNTGNVYPVVGQYAIANVDGVEVVEVEYFPDAVSIENRGGLRPFKRIKDRNLQNKNTRVVYLFLVKPGAELVKFSTGQGRRPTDLSKLDLVAPK